MVQIATAEKSNAESGMVDAARRLFVLTKQYNSEMILIEDGFEVAEVAVSVDGTWQKQGHSSKIGVVFVIAIKTGEILDCEMKSLLCFECRACENFSCNIQSH